MPRSKSQVRVDRYFPKGFVAYQPGLGIIFDSVTAGIMLSQLLYWNGKEWNKQRWIRKSENELRSETGLTRWNQETAAKTLIEHGIIEVRRKGIPATRHYRLDMDRLLEVIPSLMDSHGLVYLKPPELILDKPQSITKNTQETTHKNTRVSPNSILLREQQRQLAKKKAMPP